MMNTSGNYYAVQPLMKFELSLQMMPEKEAWLMQTRYFLINIFLIFVAPQ